MRIRLSADRRPLHVDTNAFTCFCTRYCSDTPRQQLAQVSRGEGGGQSSRPAVKPGLCISRKNVKDEFNVHTSAPIS